MNLASLTLQEYTAGFHGETDPKLGPGSSAVAEMSDPASIKTSLRRCRTRQQGAALLTVGHAIEYLVDSRLVRQQSASGAECEALAILQHANLSLYSEGTEIVSFSSRLRRWLYGGGNAKSKAARATN